MLNRNNLHNRDNSQRFIGKHRSKPLDAERGVVGERGAREPVLTKEAFIESHQRNYKRLKAYVNRPRKNGVELHAAARRELRPEAAKLLCANNTDARIAFAKAEQKESVLFFDDDDSEFAWFTLTPKQFVMSQEESRGFVIRKLQAWVRQELINVNFLAMVDIAFYTNARALTGFWKRAVSWHAHGYAWNVSKKDMTARSNSINKRFEALLPGTDVCQFKMVDGETLRGKAWYMLKAPQSAYRVYPMKRKVVDKETGEITVRPTGKFEQRKDDLRTGDLVRVCNFMVGLQLDKLAFAGGREGKELLSAVNERALKPFDKALRSAKELGRASYLRMGCRPDPEAPLI